ncbi:Sulfotransferase domain protein [Ruegeria atlantica]|uniref:Sulfotransferase domain protein n=2 Tax=Ruegeria atlantica TaxID=81569 RepID=A0A0P1F000_9RHOB|nr:Sulfotransferase domain protein [Ruegeria atlantica]
MQGMKGLPKGQWLAPVEARLPDFIICGAMKCGTSTLHSILATHPNVFIPEGEINFFDMDDIFQHSDFAFHGQGRWVGPQLEVDPQLYWKWYQNQFENAPADSIIGEDSTCYLPSEHAGSRIAMQKKAIKTIVCIRQPSQRAYSQYWHLVRSGRALFSFEDTIRFLPHSVLERSMYLSQIRRFLCDIPRERVYIFVLEEFMSDKAQVLKELSEFLGLDHGLFAEDAKEIWTNRAILPRSLKLQLVVNRLFRAKGNTRYAERLPFALDGIKDPCAGIPTRVMLKLHRAVNRSHPKNPPPMRPETREFLDAIFQRELRGLDEIVGKDLTRLWFPR